MPLFGRPVDGGCRWTEGSKCNHFPAERVRIERLLSAGTSACSCRHPAPFGRPGCALSRSPWSPVKGSSASVSPNRLSHGCQTTIFRGSPQPTQHFWTGGPETAGPGCYDAVAIARAAGFRMLVMSRIRHAVPSRSEPAKKERSKYPEKSLPDNNS